MGFLGRDNRILEWWTGLKEMRYVSLFSGIEAATAAWKPLGWECVAVAEIEPLPCSILAHYYPEVPNLGDVTKTTKDQIEALGKIDLVVFGSPCQDLSIAGKRTGLEGERSGLFYTAVRIVRWARKYCGCRFALWENVPGAFSSNEGRDFAVVVEQLSGLVDVAVPQKGWGNEGLALGNDSMLEWSTLDSQWFGVAQRRRRVFALADFGDWRDRQPILLEPESMRGDSPPRRESRKETSSRSRARLASGNPCTGTLMANAGTKLWLGNQEAFSGDYSIVDPVCFTADDYGADALLDKSPTLRAGGHHKSHQNGGVVPAIAFAQNQRDEIRYLEVAGALSSQPGMKQQTYIGIPEDIMWSIMPQNSGKDYKAREVDVAQPLMASGPVGGNQGVDYITNSYRIRRLTPLECERLQGFTDKYTAVLHKGKPSSDGPRYKALGNSMSVTVMAWIGKKIETA